MTLPRGTYRLIRDVVNPAPDRRQKHDWRAETVWEAGQKFFVEYYHDDLTDPAIRRVEARGHQEIMAHYSHKTAALLDAFELVTETPTEYLLRRCNDRMAVEILTDLVERNVLSWLELQRSEKTVCGGHESSHYVTEEPLASAERADTLRRAVAECVAADTPEVFDREISPGPNPIAACIVTLPFAVDANGIVARFIASNS